MEANALHELTAAYALDALDERDTAAYEEHLGRCERCRDELVELREAASALAFAADAPPPPAGLRDRILAQARAERLNVVPLRPRSRSMWAAVVAVAAVVAIGFGIWAASLSRSLEREREANDDFAQAVAILADPSARRVPLSGEYGTLVVRDTGQAALVMRRLPEAPEGKTYEAWVIEGGKPRPAGLFEGGSGPRAVVLDEPVPAGAQVAATIEEAGGADSPRGEPVFSAGT
jgi:predicted anti-sigma-YlaC factor YlaD